MVKIQANDLMMRLIKLIFVVTVLNPSGSGASAAYTFINENMFKMFYEGMGYLASSVIGQTTAQQGNIFVFFDLIFDYYVNPYLWLSIIGQLSNPLTIIIGLVNLGGIWAFALAGIGVIYEYVVCLMFVYMLLVLSPLFFLFMIFGLTKAMFKGWITILVSYVLKPTILAIMFLILTSICQYLLASSLMKTCINLLFTISITIDFESLIGLPFKMTVDIPIQGPFLLMAQPKGDIFLTTIMFSFLHGCLSFATLGLHEYVNKISNALTGAELESPTGGKEGRSSKGGGGGDKQGGEKGKSSAPKQEQQKRGSINTGQGGSS